MGLDYTQGCVNFRDVGAFLNLIADKVIFPENKIFRGGSIDYVESLDEINHPQTIVNLKNSHDAQDFDLDYYHFPMANKIEKYDTTQKEVRTWLNEIMNIFEEDELKYPVLIHCLSGKDRTGIVVASLLWIAGIDEAFIVEEYLLSDGEVKAERILQSLEGIKSHANYFNRVDLEKVRKNVFFNDEL